MDLASSAITLGVQTSLGDDRTDKPILVLRRLLASECDGPPVFGGHTYTTLYSYDALGSLLQVTQQGGTTDQSKGGSGRSLTIRWDDC